MTDTSGSKGNPATSQTGRLADRMDREASAASDRARAAAGEVRHEAEVAIDEVKHRAADEVEAGKSRMTSLLSDVASAVNAASGELDQRQQSRAAEYARSVGSGLERMAQSVDGRSPEQMVGDVSSFARNHPAAFLGGALLVGVALGRFARASVPSNGSDELERGQPPQDGHQSQGGSPPADRPHAASPVTRPPAPATAPDPLASREGRP